MTYKKFPRGSEWSKWDLHIHTPCSIVQEYGGNTEEAWGKFISDLESRVIHLSRICFIGVRYVLHHSLGQLMPDGWQKAPSVKSEKEFI